MATIAAACNASLTTTGGDPLFDAAPPSASAPDGGDACVPTDAQDSTWSSLYADFFGPTGTAQCGDTTRSDGTSTSSCHHDATGNGALASGFICGDTSDSCYQGITSPSAQFAGERVVAACQPSQSFLLTILRHDGGGIMPLYPASVAFSDADMARVRAWIAAGAPQN